MPRRRQNWRDNLSQPRYTPEQIQAQQLRNQAAENRLYQFPLEMEAREAQLARARGAEAQARYKLQKEIETDRQKAAFYNGLQELESNLNAQGFGIGTKQHAEAFAAYAHAFPLARSSSDVDKTLQLHAKVNDDQAALTQRIQATLGALPEGYKAKGGTMTSSGKTSVQFATEDVPEKVALRYGFLTSNVTGHLDAAQQQGAAYDKSGQLNANVDEANFLRNQYPNLPPIKGLEVSDNGMAVPAAVSALTAPTMEEQVITPDTSAPTAPAANIASPTPTPAPTSTPLNHSAALDWANANPNDPRAAAIIERAKAFTPNPDEGQ